MINVFYILKTVPSCTSIDDKIQGLVPSQTRSFTYEQDKSNLLTAEQLKEANHVS